MENKSIIVETGNQELDNLINGDDIFLALINTILELHPRMSKIKLVIPWIHHFENFFKKYRKYLYNNFPCEMKVGKQTIYLYDDFHRLENINNYERISMSYTYEYKFIIGKDKFISNENRISSFDFYIRNKIV